ncbi:putative hybrid PKS-NRPS biosynthetic cluster [Aspergillus luchuensis]|uniref:Polyketide synthase n=1 Tax=Aspergillus kawachii TaxID=1069201 RepID=A0A146FS14_ASPKA|nr:putative hybrid PKS-NRPS biosynthetic cluster [Aspergillus luchuensis]BCS04777.1 putative hybrid PKS-NRPS biosynthetic cluster [Aspergillus luchuensis]BCS16346.1 putative hybrid PKS-NRPS biosynthetic cluster [Aspergillus luchuensis]GAA85998.1 polyketide synthase [Aspergillus luchuensis IFO 4308]GAT27932.1 polyketide synthase [Aspergillus luchuensis]
MAPEREPIAIIGSASRFPGNATNPQKLWELLIHPRDVGKVIPGDRFSVDGFWNVDGSHHGTSNVTKSYFIEDDTRRFDANFFNINPREAAAIDPQHRVLLEVTYEALESAGLSIDILRGTPTGVYVGLMCADYLDVQLRDPEALAQYHATGTARSILSNRVSYFYDWKGPSVTVDTACSSSLVAVHQAVQALRQGECSTAMAAGVNLIFGPEMYIAESNLRMLSPTGKSRMWDSSADGYARGEGVGVVILKRLGDALRDGDPIESVIRETAVNSDGRTNGLTMPSSASQADLIRQTYRRAGLDPTKASDRCQYFEAHGTGTPVGDPLEAEAIHSAFFPESNDGCQVQESQLYVGSIKTVVGHTEGAAGIAGLLKASLALQHGIIPPNLHFKRLNPNIVPFYDGLHVPTKPIPWPPAQVRRASVNSFGFGGTNAHCILEHYAPSVHGGAKEGTEKPMNEPAVESPLISLPFSASSQSSLARLIQQYAGFIATHPSVDMQAVSLALQKRSNLPFKHYVTGLSHNSILQQLQDPQWKPGPSGRGAEAHNSAILGVFTGQGAQWPTMGRELLLRPGPFTATIDRLDDILQQLPDPPTWSLRQEILADPDTSRCQQSTYAQPLTTAVQVALVDLLYSVGIRFSVVVGHSSGEIGAAYAAGCITAEAAITVAYYRGLYSPRADPGEGGPKRSMMAVGMGFNEATRFCTQPEYAGKIFPAASNAPSSTTLAGDLFTLEFARDELTRQQKFARILRVDKAYHSPFMEPCAEPYMQALQARNFAYRTSGPSCTWISSVHGFEMDCSSDCVNDSYWLKNLLQPVLFSDALSQAIRDHGPFNCAIEVGPHPALAGPTGQTFKALQQNVPAYQGALTRGENDVLRLSKCLGEVWKLCGPSSVDLRVFQSLINGEDGTLPAMLPKVLPSYPWDHERPYWRESRASKEYRTRAPSHELLGVCVEQSEQLWRWRNILHPREIPWLQGHEFQGEMLFPAAGYCIMAMEAALRFSYPRPVRLLALRDLDIRRGISIDGSADGIELRCHLGPNSTREPKDSSALEIVNLNFTCIAGHVDGSDVLTTRFTTRVRLEMGSPDLTVLPRKQQQSPGNSPVDIERFYGSMSRLGLNYTGPFHSLLASERRLFHASATVAHVPSSSSFMHPGVLDTCFQTLFVAFASPDDESLRTPHLPREIQSIRFNPAVIAHADHPRGSPFQVESYVTKATPPTRKIPSDMVGDIDVYTTAGDCVMQIESLRCVALAVTTEKDDRAMFHRTHWEIDIDAGMVVSFDKPNTEYSTILERYEAVARQAIDGTPPAIGDIVSPELQLIQKAISLHFAPPSEVPGAHAAFKAAQNRYWKTSAGAQRMQEYVVRTVKQVTHKYPRMRILLFLGGNDDVSVARGILDAINGNCTSLILTDSSSETLKSAKERLKPYGDAVQVETLDLGTSPPEILYDMVIVQIGVLGEGAASIPLGYCRRVLKTGGFLLFGSITGRGNFAGCLQGRLVDDHSVNSEPERIWEALLQQSGFSGLDSVAYDTGNPRLHCHSLILSRAMDASLQSLQHPLAYPDQTNEAVDKDHVLIIGGHIGIGSRGLQALRSHLSKWNRGFTNVASLEDLGSYKSQKIPSHVLCLTDVDAPLFQNLSAEKFAALQMLFQDTHNVYWVTRGFKQGDPYSAMTVGLGRVVQTELQGLNLGFLDIDAVDENGITQIATRFAQFVNHGQHSHAISAETSLWCQEREVSLENGLPYIPRVKHAQDMNARFNSAFRAIEQPLGLDASLAKQSDTASELEVVSSVIARSAHALKLTNEVDAYLCLVNIKCTEGDRLGLIISSSAEEKVVVCKRDDILDIGPRQDHRISAPEILSILVALHISERVQASLCYSTTLVFTNDPWLLRVLAMSRESDQRALLLATSDEGAMEWDKSIIYVHSHTPTRKLMSMVPQSVSKFINLDTEFQPLHDRLLAAIPKTCATHSANDYLSERASIGHVLSPSQSSRDVLDMLWTQWLISSAALQGIMQPDTVVPHSHSACAVKSYTPQENPLVTVHRLDPSTILRRDATYLLVGMTGELGQSLCRWLVANGAKHLVIASRSVKPVPWHEELQQSSGCQLMTLPLDVCDMQALRIAHQTILQSMPPIAGVVNGAMVLADAIFVNMAYEDFIRVLEPKVRGSRNLDELFSGNELDFFIMLSSTASLIGNAGQSNYSAANMYMKALAEQRRKRGLAGSCFDIGMILGVGVVSRERVYEEPLRKAGLMPIAEPDFHCMFTEAMWLGRPDMSTNSSSCFSTGLHVPPGPVRPAWYHDPRFSHFQVPEEDASRSAGAVKDAAVTLGQQLRYTSELTRAEDLIQEAFVVRLQGLLQLTGPIEDVARALSELGIDSLLAIEIKTWFFQELGFQISVMKILNGISVRGVCREAAEHVFRAKAAESDEGASTVESVKVLKTLETPTPRLQEDEATETISTVARTQETPFSDTSSQTSHAVETPTSSQILPVAGLSTPTMAAMSTEQEKIWFMLQSVDDPAMYNCTIQYELHGPLDRVRFQAAVTEVAQRHESLRTAYVTDPHDQVPRRVILGQPQITWREVGMKSDDKDVIATEFEALQTRAFDLAKGQTMAITILSHGSARHSIIFGYHHLIMDGVSWQMVLREFAAAYKDRQSLSPVVAQYSAFCNQKGSTSEATTPAWNEGPSSTDTDGQLPDDLPLFPFARTGFRTRTRTSYETIRVSSYLGTEDASRVRSISSRTGATSFHIHLAAIQLLLQQTLEVDRFCLGIAHANRNDPRFERVVGLMVEVVPLMFEPQQAQGFKDLVKDTRSRVLGALSQAHGSAKSSRPFDIVVNYIAGVTHDIMFDEAVLKYSTSEDARQPHDLVITVRDNPDGTTVITFGALEYLYHAHDVQLLLDLYVRLLSSVSLNSDLKLEQYRCLEPLCLKAPSQPPTSQAKLSAIQKESDRLTQWIARIEATYPDTVALKDANGRELTYAVMESRVRSIMDILLAVGVQPRAFVVVACGPSVDTVCALLAIWRLGAVYVPADLEHGVERLSLILKDCSPAALVCRSKAGVEHFMADQGPQVVELKMHLPPPSPATLDYDRSTGQDPAILIYTSGTTGVPKGVLLSHDNLLCHFAAVQQVFPVDQPVVLQQSSHNFDASLFQICVSLLHGGTLVMTSNRQDPIELAEWMVREKVSLTLGVTSEYALWLGEAASVLRKCTSWQYALCGGEKMSSGTLQGFSGLNVAGLRLINAYGPCEASVACTMGEIDYKRNNLHDSHDPIPVGQPLPTYAIHILDDQLQPVAAGWPGEICISGGSVSSSGYWNREDETSARFRVFNGIRIYRTGDYGRILPNGNLEYRGRLKGDSQIKLRGMRLELEEISSVLVQTSQGVLREAAVIVKGHPEPYLVAFVVFSTSGSPANVGSFLDALRSGLPLPTYAKPTAITPIDRIPLTTSGKVDRTALARLEIHQHQSVSSTSGALNIIEMKLKELWQELLPATGLSITPQSNFFDLGGNSLQILRLHGRIRAITKVSVPVVHLFQCSTLSEMAQLIGAATSAHRASSPPLPAPAASILIDWEAETAVPSFFNNLITISDPHTQLPFNPPREVILTGATGFYGTAFLDHLLSIPSITRIHCLAIRHNADGSPRQLEHLISPKVHLYSGNLSHPTLNLTEAEIAHLASTADCIIHNGADVSFVKPYSALRAPNVDSTKFLFNLAISRGIPFHYISTASVTSLSGKDEFLESSVASYPPPMDGSPSGHTVGYTASKWASEVFLEKASTVYTDVPVCIYRPTAITGEGDMAMAATSGGVIESVLDLSRRMRAIPETWSWRGYIDLIGVKKAAEMVVRRVVGGDEACAGGVRYSHVCGEKRFKASDLRMFLEKEEGSEFQQVEWKEWLIMAAEYGIDDGVAAYLEGLRGESGSSAELFFLPLLGGGLSGC